MANTPVKSPNKNDLVIDPFNERINTLEARNAFQDDIIDQLNNELANHQEQIAILKAQLEVIAGRLKEIQLPDQVGNEVEPPPPHY